jgi:uncharacterized protein
MIPRSARALLRVGLLASAVLLCAVGPAGALAPSDSATTPAEASIPQPAGYVNDRAGVISEPERARLEAFLAQLHRKTGTEFAVLTVPTTAPLTPTDYKVRVFEQWKIGKKGEDTGLLLLVAIAEREARFETGYGLEGTLPDGYQSRVFRREMAPRFQQGDYEGGIRQGVLAMAARIAAEKGVTLEWNGQELRYDEGSSRSPAGGLVVALIVFLAIVILISIASSGGGGGGIGGRRRGYGWGPYWGGWGGGGLGGGWGGGGFGGGSFGGGGGGFGGFGGGASGGGGGGGKW